MGCWCGSGVAYGECHGN
ncbi:SEC-C metal-binding domain-containing protein [Streptomyces sp. ID05-47C]